VFLKILNKQDLANQYFQFKQFIIYQENCAMKVGTDGVLLGALACLGDQGNVLDVGTGTGLLSLMAAQRSSATIDAIDIDAAACTQASENVKNSPWSSRINVMHTSFQEHVLGGKRYTRILTNPPFFSNSLKSDDIQRNLARHDDSLSQRDLLSGVNTLLADDGNFILILPWESNHEFCLEASHYYLYCNKRIIIHPTPQKKPNRIIMEFSHTKGKMLESDLIIREADGNYTNDYKRITSDFYLSF